MTSRESDVFCFLAHRAGQVLSKRRSLDGVWSDDLETDPNIVEVYIARLRRKLTKHSGFATVDTIRGAGYRLDGADMVWGVRSRITVVATVVMLVVLTLTGAALVDANPSTSTWTTS